MLQCVLMKAAGPLVFCYAKLPACVAVFPLVLKVVQAQLTTGKVVLACGSQLSRQGFTSARPVHKVRSGLSTNENEARAVQTERPPALVRMQLPQILINEATLPWRHACSMVCSVVCTSAPPPSKQLSCAERMGLHGTGSS
jgi:hypothetical protein